jgi:tRNA threonylcarbamoyladenosine biosynthesis protein TsaB
MMKVLALDTASAACSVALWADGVVVARRWEARDRGHAERLMPMVAEVLAEAGTPVAALDRLAVTVGPGAFTGLRIGLAAARGLAVATGLPVVGLTSFAVVAAAIPEAERRGRSVLVAVESRRAEGFLQRFDTDLSPVGPAEALTPAACAAWLPAGPLLVTGDGAAALRPVLAARPDTTFADGPGLPDAAVLAGLAAVLPAGDGLPPRPLYLRAPDATLPAGSPS